MHYMLVKKYMQYMQNIYIDYIMDNSICRKWYGKFENENFHLKDVSGRSIIIDSDKIKTLIDNRHLIIWDTDQTLNTYICLKKYIFRIVLDTWILHKLNETIDWISDLLLKICYWWWKMHRLQYGKRLYSKLRQLK